MAGYNKIPGMPIKERKQMVKGMLLTETLYLEFGKIKNYLKNNYMPLH